MFSSVSGLLKGHSSQEISKGDSSKLESAKKARIVGFSACSLLMTLGMILIVLGATGALGLLGLIFGGIVLMSALGILTPLFVGQLKKSRGLRLTEELDVPSKAAPTDLLVCPIISSPFREDQDPVIVFPEKLSDSDNQNLSALTRIVKSRMQKEFIVPNDLKKILLKVRFSQDKTKLFRDNGILTRINNNGPYGIFQVKGYPDFVCKAYSKKVLKNSLKEGYEELIRSKALCEFLNLDLIRIPNVRMIEVSSYGEVYDVMVMEKINFEYTSHPRVYTCGSTLIQLTAFSLFSGYWDFDANNVVHTGLKIGEGPTVAVIDFDKFREHSPYYGLTKLIHGVYSKKNLQSIKKLVDRTEIEIPSRCEENEDWRSFNSQIFFDFQWKLAMENATN